MRHLIIVGLMLVGTSASGQGWVYFSNRVLGSLDAPVTGCGGLLQGTGYTAQLFGGPAGTADAALLPLTPQTTFRTTAAAAGTVMALGVVVPGVAPGQIARLQMRVWDNRMGTVTSWSAAAIDPGFQSGVSASFDSPPLTPMTEEPVLLTGLRSFHICPIRLAAPVPAGNNSFSMKLTAPVRQSYAVETSSNLVNWSPLVTLSNMTGMIQFQVTNAPPLPARFYRARTAP